MPQGENDHSWAVGALIIAQVMVSSSLSSCPADSGKVMLLPKVLTGRIVILKEYKAGKYSRSRELAGFAEECLPHQFLHEINIISAECVSRSTAITRFQPLQTCLQPQMQ